MKTSKESSKPPIKRTLKQWMIFLGKIALILFVAIFWLGFYVKFDVLANNQYHNLWIHCPSVVEEDEPFNITVEIWDKFERLVGDYTGEILIQLESYRINGTGYDILSAVNWTLFESNFQFTSNYKWGSIYPAYLVTGADNGKRNFNVSISTPGVHYFRVTDLSTGDIFRSNPVIVASKGSTFDRLYWGDIHGHSYFSDGSGNPSDLYQFARDVALLDFAAITDHAEIFPQFGDVVIGDKFQEYIQITNSFNDDGQFTTIVALEWTPLLGTSRSYLCNQHMNFYFSGDDMPFFSTFTLFTPDEIYEYILENSNDEFMTWTHHVLRRDYGSDYGFYNETYNRMIEIYSEHGCGEFTDPDLNPFPSVHSFREDEYGFSVNDALRMGRKFGFMASGDSHDGRLGHSIVHTEARGAVHVYPLSIAGYNLGAYPGGLTGLYAEGLNRSQVFGSLQSRSAYATTWVNRHFMNFSINNIRVGQQDSTVNVADVNTTRLLEITIVADGISTIPNTQTNISKVEIFKNSELWRTELVNDIIFHQVFNDSATITGTNYTHCIQKADGNWYIHERSTQPVDPNTLNTHGADYYYVRMTDSNGGVGWIGPIWVDPAP